MAIKPPLLLIDGKSEPGPDDAVEIYPSVESLCEYLEPWFAKEPHAILDAEGTRLELVTDGTILRLIESRAPSRPDLVRAFLIGEIQSAAAAYPGGAAKPRYDNLGTASLDALWQVHCSTVQEIERPATAERSFLGRLKRFLGGR